MAVIYARVSPRISVENRYRDGDCYYSGRKWGDGCFVFARSRLFSLPPYTPFPVQIRPRYAVVRLSDRRGSPGHLLYIEPVVLAVVIQTRQPQAAHTPLFVIRLRRPRAATTANRIITPASAHGVHVWTPAQRCADSAATCCCCTPVGCCVFARPVYKTAGSWARCTRGSKRAKCPRTSRRVSRAAFNGGRAWGGEALAPGSQMSSYLRAAVNFYRRRVLKNKEFPVSRPFKETFKKNNG